MSHGGAVAVRELWYAVEALRAPHRSRAAVERRALGGVRGMLEHARREVPHYRDPAYDVRVESLADLARLPVLTKAEVRAAPERFHAPGPGWFQVDRTSGSTGRALEVRHDAYAYGYHGATLLRRFLAAGCRPWWTIAHIKPYPRPSRWFQRFGVFRRTVVSAGLPERELAEGVLALRPRVLMGYPVMLRAVLRELSDAELAVLRRRLRLVLSESELLTDEIRALLTRGYGVPVRDEYSAFEVLTIASECRHGSLHVDEDRVYLEVVDPADHRRQPDGEPGVPVVTHFRERAMPLVRYLVDDRVVGRSGAVRVRQQVPADTPARRPHRGRRGAARRAAGLLRGLLAGRGHGAGGGGDRRPPGRAGGDHRVAVLDRDGGRSFEEVAADVRACLLDQLDLALPMDVVQVDRIELTPGGKARLVTSAYRLARGDAAVTALRTPARAPAAPAGRGRRSGPGLRPVRPVVPAAPDGWEECIREHGLHRLWDWRVVHVVAAERRGGVVAGMFRDGGRVVGLGTARLHTLGRRHPVGGAADVEHLAFGALPGIALGSGLPRTLHRAARVLTCSRPGPGRWRPPCAASSGGGCRRSGTGRCTPGSCRRSSGGRRWRARVSRSPSSPAVRGLRRLLCARFPALGGRTSDGSPARSRPTDP